MATSTAKKSDLKKSVNNGYQKPKDYAKNKSKQSKSNGRKYKSDIRDAYDIGYARGWDNAYDIPKRFGSTTVAAHGYKKGIKCRRKTDKYTKQYARKGKKD